MENIADALRYAIPSVVVFLTAYLMMKAFFGEEKKRRDQETVMERVRISMPIRLQAHERIVLMLERMNPSNLVVRIHQPKLSAAEFHRQLIQTIRDEFNHNLSQQVYVSIKAWDMVKNTKEEIVRQINTAAAQLDEKATATDLSNRILELTVEKQAVANTLDYIKKEIAQVF
jgi:hypothetical protein